MLQFPILAVIATLGSGLALTLLAVHSSRQICLFFSLVALFIGVAAAVPFDKATLGFQFMNTFNLLSSRNLSLALGVDGLSFVFLILTLVTFPPLFLAA